MIASLAPNKALIQLGSVKFAPSASALVDTLFASGGTASGIYSVRKNGVMFKRGDGSPLAFLVANPGQSRFFVTAFRQADGRTRYMHGGLTDADASALGVSAMSYSQRNDEAERLWVQLRPASL